MAGTSVAGVTAWVPGAQLANIKMNTIAMAKNFFIFDSPDWNSQVRACRAWEFEGFIKKRS